MQVLAPMMLYDSNGQSLMVYAPSTLSASPKPSLTNTMPGAPSCFSYTPSDPSSSPSPYPTHSLTPMANFHGPSYFQGGVRQTFPLGGTPSTFSSMAALPFPPIPTGPLPLAAQTFQPPRTIALAPSTSFISPPAPVAIPSLPPAVDDLFDLPSELLQAFPQQHFGTGTNVYISNLPNYITKEALHALFAQHGTVLSCRVAKKQGQCPIGFVQFTEPSMAQSAVSAINGTMLEQGRFVRVKLANHDKDRGVVNNPSSDLYICNVPQSWSYTHLHSAFSDFGRVSSLNVFKDSVSGRSLGSGMVRFGNTLDAAAALQGLNRLQTADMPRPLEVKFAETRADKDRRITNRMQCSPAPFADSKDFIPGIPQPSQPIAIIPLSPWSAGSFGPPPAAPPNMSAMLEFSRVMNSSAGDARQSLMSVSNGLQSGAQLQGGYFPFTEGYGDTAPTLLDNAVGLPLMAATAPALNPIVSIPPRLIQHRVKPNRALP